MAKQKTHNIIERYNNTQDKPPSPKERADSTLQTINQLKVAPNPVHFAVLYERLQSIDPYFSDQVNRAIENKTYNDTTAETLFIELISKFLHHQIPTEEVELLLSGLLNHIESWVKNAHQKQEHICNEIDYIAKQPLPPEVLRRLKNSIIPALKEIHDDTTRLQEQVNQSSDEIKQLKQELEQANAMAKTDELTGIPNRRGFNELIRQEINQAINQGASFALVIIDIDFFKMINDTFGHLIGDSVLRYISRVLGSETKGKDHIARIGGEEFVLVLPNTNYDGAIKVADNIRLKISGKKLNVKNHDKPLDLTVSAGVAMYQMNEDLDDLMHRADQALYLAKNNGRNQVCGEDKIL